MNINRRSALLIGLTSFNIGLQLSSAALLKVATGKIADLFTVALLLATVLVLNGARFLTWGALHKRFPISVAYPLSALFFPAVVALAWWMDEPIGMAQLVGAVLVMAGVARLLAPSRAESDANGLID